MIQKEKAIKDIQDSFKDYSDLMIRQLNELENRLQDGTSKSPEKDMKKIGICCDHAGFELKEYVRGWLEAKGWEYKDFGTYSTDSCDYPDFAHPLALAVEASECYPGIAICGSGNGISMTLNKHQGIRAALCWTAEIAHMARLHNDANVLVMPGRYISTEEADMIMTEFFSTEFEGGRHQKRIDKIPVK